MRMPAGGGVKYGREDDCHGADNETDGSEDHGGYCDRSVHVAHCALGEHGLGMPPDHFALRIGL